MEAIKQKYDNAEASGLCGFIPFVTCGYPTKETTVPLLFTLEKAGAMCIEVGIPYSDPQADGETIQQSSYVALNENDITPQICIDTVAKAREEGLKVPIVFMTYYNPVLQFGEGLDMKAREEQFVSKSKDAGVNGFIFVDLPIEESGHLRKCCTKFGMSYIPLVTPTTTEQRLKEINNLADTFVYAVSRNAVTGRTDTLDEQKFLKYISRVRKHIKKRVAIGFGVRTLSDFKRVAKVADACIIGSQVIRVIDENWKPDEEDAMQQLTKGVFLYARKFKKIGKEDGSRAADDDCVIS